MLEFRSPYYPPRARWYGRLIQPWHWLRRRLRAAPPPVTDFACFRTFILTLFLPGYSFGEAGHRWVAGLYLLVYPALVFSFLLNLGYSTANIALALMLGLHTASILFILRRRGEVMGYAQCIGLACAVLIALGTLVYFPFRHWVTGRCFPVRRADQVVIVNRRIELRTLRQGDVVAYLIPSLSPGQGYYVQAGYGLDPLLAVAGDEVRFTASAVVVNGVLLPTQANMPTNGVFIVPEGKLFIWPTLGQRGRWTGHAESLLRAIALVDESRFVGKAYAYWFWRKQILP